MSIRVCIVDDDQLAIKELMGIISKIPDLQIVATETNSIIAISKILSGVIKADIVFADVEMPDINGIEFSRQVGDRVVVIFVTAHAGFALEAFRTDAVDFVTKPIDIKELLHALQKAKEKILARNKLLVAPLDLFMYLKLTPRKVEKINLKDLIYLDVEVGTVNIYIQDEKIITINRSLTSIEVQLPNDIFMRISRSCIVNSYRIKRVEMERMLMDNGKVLMIGSNYIASVYDRYNSLG